MEGAVESHPGAWVVGKGQHHVHELTLIDVYLYCSEGFSIAPRTRRPPLVFSIHVRFLTDSSPTQHAPLKFKFIPPTSTSRRHGQVHPQGTRHRKRRVHLGPPNSAAPYSDRNASIRLSTSERMWGMRPWIGHAAASPSAQIVRPSTSVSSRSMSISRVCPRPSAKRSIMFIIHVVPSRQGVHWPQDSCL